VLDEELETFEKHKAELLGSAEGRWVLIRNGEILGTFESQADAIDQGYQKLGLVPFLVKRIEQVESPESYLSNLIAL
jgi:hypothetical protein